jgi:hypothetical protein
MTTFDDREQGFEKRFALDQEQEFKATARRNRLLGEWAAGLMGLEGKHVAEYAQAVVKSDFEQPGEDDVLRKVFEDLKGRDPSRVEDLSAASVAAAAPIPGGQLGSRPSPG